VTDCGAYRELLGGYVLGALSAEDTATVEQHIESCPRCGREYGELAGLPPLLDLVGSAEAELEGPPASLEEAVLDRFARERRGLSGAAAQTPRRGLRLGLALAGAALAAAVVVVATGWFSSSESRAFGHARLTGTGANAYADLHAVRAGTYVDLRVRGLRGAPRGVYELWCIPDRGGWISGGTFRVDTSGRAHVELTSAARPGDYERMVITRRAASEREEVLAGSVQY
jgi:anti-sigma-K factor RskA